MSKELIEETKHQIHDLFATGGKVNELDVDEILTNFHNQILLAEAERVEGRMPELPKGKHTGKSFCPQCEDTGSYHSLTDTATDIRSRVITQ